MISDNTEGSLLANFARATGIFTLACEDGSATCTITDYFDFEDPREGISNRELLIQALDDYERGNIDDASARLGAIFCKEGENEQPTETSVPIAIEINRPVMP